MATIQVHVPEAYALDDQGNQLDKMVIKHARTQAGMEHQLSAFKAKWSQESVSTLPMAVRASCDSTRHAVKSWRSLLMPE